MKTEEEARKWWCPFARVAIESYGMTSSAISAINRHDDEYYHKRNRCIASECMAWRWAGWVTAGRLYPKGIEAVNSEHVGYCGLAGKP